MSEPSAASATRLDAAPVAEPAAKLPALVPDAHLVAGREPVEELAPVYQKVALKAAMILQQNLERYENLDLTPSQLRDVAIVAGIMVDKHLDYRDGRKGAALVDNSQHLTIPPGTTLEDIRKLRDSLREEA